MLYHINTKEAKPKRVIVLGAKGFIGSATVAHLLQDGVNVLALGRENIDLCNEHATDQLIEMLSPDDVLVIAAAKSPCKTYTELLENIAMMKMICDALVKQPVKQVIYISSDAVYADSMEKLTESSPAAPTSLHGVMHLAREQMLASIVAAEDLLFIRPTLVYGVNDLHNGYGPNSFYRLVRQGKPIKLFGQGEERRDHVHVSDVAEIIRLCLLQHSYGVFNAVTGEVISFFEIAEKITQLFDSPVEIQYLPRSGPMPHDGYRAFDVALSKKVFPDFVCTSFSDGLLWIHNFKEGTNERN